MVMDGHLNVSNNFDSVVAKGEHFDNSLKCAEDGSIVKRYCFDKETYCNMPSIDKWGKEYC